MIESWSHLESQHVDESSRYEAPRVVVVIVCSEYTVFSSNKFAESLCKEKIVFSLVRRKCNLNVSSNVTQTDKCTSGKKLLQNHREKDEVPKTCVSPCDFSTMKITTILRHCEIILSGYAHIHYDSVYVVWNDGLSYGHCFIHVWFTCLQNINASIVSYFLCSIIDLWIPTEWNRNLNYTVDTLKVSVSAARLSLWINWIFKFLYFNL